MTTRIALVLAIILGVVAAVAVQGWTKKQEAENRKKLEPVRILVAKKSVKKGQQLKRSDLEMDEVSKPHVISGMIPFRDGDLHLNKIVNCDIERGWPILKQFLEQAGSKPYPVRRLVSPGKRAVTLRVDQLSSISYMVRPGHYIDIIGTFQVEVGKERLVKTVCLLEAVKVLAIDNQVMDVTTRGKKTQTYRTITLEVDPKVGVKLINASNEGQLVFMLRDNSDVTPALNASGDYKWEDIGKK